jgi:hypothetical protein
VSRLDHLLLEVGVNVELDQLHRAAREDLGRERWDPGR